MVSLLKSKAAVAVASVFLIASPLGWAEPKPLPGVSSGAQVPQSNQPILKQMEMPAQVETVKAATVPADTVLNVKLSKPLSSARNEQGESVTATLDDPLYVGPFLLAPEGSTITGKITEINKKAVKKGPNPYIIVDFYELQRLNENTKLPFQASLIAYQTGLKRKDYVWRLPDKKSRLRSNLSGMLSGAAYGIMVNPIFGGPVGAGFGLLKSVAINKVAERGTVKIKETEVIPISIQSAFNLPVISSGKQELGPYSWEASGTSIK